MEAYSNGIASIRHHETGRIHEIEGDMLDWEIVDGDERQMGPEYHHEAAFEHPELGKIVWGLWEYPIGVENYRKTDAGPHEVVEDLDYGLLHTREDSDNWFEPPPPDDPFAVFMDSYHGSSDLPATAAISYTAWCFRIRSRRWKPTWATRSRMRYFATGRRCSG